ncbi:MAG: DNA polymerase II large subunit [Candidatus Aenigmarchaeota archaeon ex4484_52]|nr:MAG: DNA polymerase II large subunit [Candidatus Aenigmarchaeota archaeon ex4484_52]
MKQDTNTKAYYSLLEEKTKKCYEIAKTIKAKGMDIEDNINIPIAKDLAARVEGLISSFYPEIKNCGIQEAIRDLEKKYSKNSERVALEIGRDIASQKYVKFKTKQKALELALRVSLGYLTQGVVTAPLEGLTEVKLKQNADGSQYAAVYYSGPIRSAGGTASAISVIALDFIRKSLGIADYVPEKKEIQRYITEIDDYTTRIVEKQYNPSEQEIEMMIKNIGVEITGDPTEKIDVSNYKDLPRVETNKIRGGMCLVLLDGIPLKAEKLFKRIKKYPKEYDLENWLWLEEFIELKHKLHTVANSKKTHEKYLPNTKYLSKIIAGRPVFSFPSEKGGFNLRYGRSRTGGLASTAIHPGAMYLLEFAAIGTQLALEFPGKASVGTVCDTINPPIVKLEDESVVEINTKEDAKKYKNNIKEILSLGDILIPFGEFLQNNHILLPSCFCQEWWAEELKEAIKTISLKEEEKQKILGFTKKPFKNPDFLIALEISKKLNISLHPEYVFFWHDIDKEQLKTLIFGLQESIEKENDFGDFIFDLEKANKTKLKQILEELLILHKIYNDKFIIKKNTAQALFYCLFNEFEIDKIKSKDAKEQIKIIDDSKDSISAINKLSNFKIPAKALQRVGMKMGRPEKAERRILKGSPQLLFPCGSHGGRTRNLIETAKKKKIFAKVSNYICPICKKQTPFCFCTKCKTRTILTENEQEYSNGNGQKLNYCNMELNVDNLLKNALENIEQQVKPKLLKAVRGVMGKNRSVEFIEKGLLRCKYNLYVNKDGTIRYDSMNVPITHFKPKEIGVGIEDLKKLGYLTDANNKPLVDKNQILELKPQDIIISDNSIFSGANYLIQICKFIDELLIKFYHQNSFYNVKTKQDLLGHLVIGLAPHTSAGIVGRIIGFTPAKIGYAHPFWHAAKRRNCLAPDTQIPIINNGNCNIISLSDLYKKIKNPEKIIDDFGTKEKKIENIKTISLNKKTGILEEKNIISIIQTQSPKHLIKIQLKSGKYFVASPEHIVYFIVDTIKKIDIVESKSKYLYDIEVEFNHNFLINDFILTNNCDGDEDSIMMLMDALLNFSQNYLPDTRGGRSMDAPLVLTGILNPEEIDDEAWNIDIDENYPLSFYRQTMQYKNPKQLLQKPRTVESVLNTNNVFHINYTHNTEDINNGVLITKYVWLQSMEDKVNAQLNLCKLIKAVDENKVAEQILIKHFLKDIKGNLRTFSRQSVRCSICNEKYRRPPLLGVCRKCKNKLILSVSEGFVRKYLEPAKQIIDIYKISPYTCQQFKILEKQVDDLFGKKDRQMKLFRY